MNMVGSILGILLYVIFKYISYGTSSMSTQIILSLFIRKLPPKKFEVIYDLLNLCNVNKVWNQKIPKENNNLSLS